MAAEWVGGAIISGAIQALIDKMASREVLDYLLAKNDLDGLLKKLKIRLNVLTVVLDDAEQKQIRNRGVQQWLDELQDAIYDAEDLLGEIEYDAHKLKVEAESGTSTSKVSNFFSTSRNSSDGEMERKMEKILDNLEVIAKEKDVLGLKEVVREKPLRRFATTSLIVESEVVGRDADKEDLIKLLSDDVSSEKICVIPIVGIGGVGKTTLAQAAFNDVNLMFDLKVWACVSEEFDVCRITKTILEAATSNYCNVMDLNSLQVKLKEILTGKKFLLVLDDMWNENYVGWDLLSRPFKDGAQGSKIIVTTRSEIVAKTVGTVQMQHLMELRDEACWQLFTKHASGTGDFTGNSDLERIGREIVKKCKGLPLAVKTLAGLLRFTRDIGEWKRILKNDIWDFTEDESDILPALRLSYHYLPSQLKKCFAYCSIFPKDYKFDKEVLILLWMAENLLEDPKRNRRMEEVGDEYFNYLASRSFFQRSSTNRSLFVMHDLMVDLAKFVSKKYCFLLERDNLDEIAMKQLRHLAYNMTYMTCLGEPSKMFNPVSKATCLRTCLSIKLNCLAVRFSSAKEILVHDLMKLRSLRVLSFDGYENINQLPDSIGELKHLRYLNLSYTSIKELPESISMLYNLQTLKLVNCSISKLPKDFRHLVRLRYLDVRGCYLKEIPTQIGKLKCLQILSIFIVGKDNGTRIRELGELSDLRGSISIKKLQNVVHAKDALEAKLRDKYLEELELIWDGETNSSKHDRDVLDNLLPNTTLQKIEIRNYGGTKFPSWLGDRSFRNMVDIALWDCKYCDILPPLGTLSSLKNLQIGRFDAVTNVGPEFYGNSSSTTKPFASLESLALSHMSNWNNWLMPVEDAEAFPNLRKLSIHNCKTLIGIPPCFLPCLTELIISNCPQLASSLPRMPVVSKLNLGGCESLLDISGCQVIELFGCLRCLEISSQQGPITFTCLPATLKSLDITNCKNFEFSLSRSYDSLQWLSLKHSCGSIVSFPMDSFPKMRYLRIEGCQNLESLSPSDGLCEGLLSLSSLCVSYCPSLIFPSGELPCPNLTALEINGCDKVFASWRSWNLRRLANLESFKIGNCKVEDMESFPEKGLLPATITYIKIDVHPYLKVLDIDELQELTSLKLLSINIGPNLQTMTGERLPTSLKHMVICDCPLLEEKLQREKGVYWKKISHIPNIRINHRYI